MPQSKATTFGECAKSVRRVYGSGRVTDADHTNLERGYWALFDLIRDLAGEQPKFRVQAEKALQDLHPRTDYDVATMIRDIADTCITLSRLKAGGGRSVETKVTDAKALCEYLKDEFKT